MAHPDLGDGWFKLAYELLPALLTGGFRREAAIVLCEILAQTYGRGKHATARIEPAKIAARTRRSRANIWRGIRELLDDRVIERHEDGTYKFRKDYAKWGSNKEPLIDESLQQYCAAYPILAKSYEPHGEQDDTVSQGDTPSANTNGCTVSPCDTASANADDSSVSPCDTVRVSQGDTLSGIPPRTPLVGVRIEELIDDDACACEATEPNGIRSPEHRATVDLARELFGDVFADTVLQMGRDIEQSLGGRWDCYRAAMARVSKSRKTNIDNLHAYCIRTGGQFAATCIPPEPVAFNPAPPTSKAKSRKQDEAFERAAAELEDD